MVTVGRESPERFSSMAVEMLSSEPELLFPFSPGRIKRILSKPPPELACLVVQALVRG